MDWTQIVSGAIVAVINAGAILIATRYLGRVLDHVEKPKK